MNSIKESPIIPIFIVLIGLLVVGIFLKRTPPVIAPSPSTTPKAATIVKIKNKNLNVKVAKTSEELQKGLGGVASMTDDEGMLFVFPVKDTRQTFWMKGTLMSLDIFWINDGKVKQISANLPVPSPSTPDNQLPLYPSNDPVDYVLETAGGFAQRYDIKVGDEVIIP